MEVTVNIAERPNLGLPNSTQGITLPNPPPSIGPPNSTVNTASTTPNSTTEIGTPKSTSQPESEARPEPVRLPFIVQIPPVPKTDKPKKTVSSDDNSQKKTPVSSTTMASGSSSESTFDLGMDESEFEKQFGQPCVSHFIEESWKLPVKIGDVEVRGILDSGANVSVINPAVLHRIPAALRRSRTSNESIRGISGESLAIMERVTLPVKIGIYTFTVEFCVVDTRDQMILGMNIIVGSGAIIDFARGIFRLGTEEIVMFKDSPPAAKRLEVRRAITIPAMTEQVVELCIRKKMPNGTQPMIVNPSSRFTEETGLIVGRTLTNVHENNVHVLVANPCKHAIAMHKGLSVGTASAIESVAGPIGTKAGVNTVMTKGQLPDHMQELMNRVQLSENDKIRCHNLLVEYCDIFSSPDSPLGQTDIVKHRINTKDASPIKLRQRRLPIKQQEIIDLEIQKMLDLGVIEPSTSPWSAQIVLVKKKDGQNRFCIDYRQLNHVTVKDSYPLPNIQDTFDALAGANYFCSLDLASGYWQVDMAEEDRPKTAFATRSGLYQFRTMPFGLSNAPATFERLMESMLRGYLWERCMCYLDDVIVYGKTFDQTLENLRLVFDRVREAGLKLKPKKCELFKREILYLGFIVNGTGVHSDPKKIAAVKDWPVPCSIPDVRSFLGFANYHRRFVKDYAEIAEPLTALTRGKTPFRWGSEQHRAFNALKEALIEAPKLAHPKPGSNTELILDTDASGFALGGVLSQIVDGQEEPLGFASKTLSRTQRNYCTTYRELLAVVEMTQHFRHYLWGRKFRIRTDHSSLRWLKNYRDADGMLARWLAKLQQYDFVIEHRPGAAHGNADGLSRCHSCKNDDCPGKLIVPQTPAESSYGELELRALTIGKDRKLSPMLSDDPTPIPIADRNLSTRQRYHVRALDDRIVGQKWLSDFNVDDIATMQRNDSSVGKVHEWVTDKARPTNKEIATYGEEVKTLCSRWKQLFIDNGVLKRKIHDSGRKADVIQTILPSDLRNLVLHQLHDLRVVGHLGIQRTIFRVKQRFYWPGIALDVARWCAKCPECAARKGKPHPRKAPLTQLPTGAPFDRVAMDILDTHRPTSKGYRYILVISDYFSKYSDAYPLRRHTAKAVADVFVNRWIVYHGVPKVVHSDQGTEFESALFKRTIELLGAKKIRTSPYRPQSDGQVERLNRTLINMLSAFTSDVVNDWDIHLPYLLMAYRTSVHSSTGCTPHIMVYGNEANLPIDLVFPTPDDDNRPPCAPEYVEYLRNTIRTTHDFARDHLRKSAIRQKRGYDAHAKERPPFQLGDLVRYYYLPTTQGNKFARPWTGPWRVTARPTEIDYTIQKVSEPGKTRTVHFDLLKRYEQDIVSEPSTSADHYDDTETQRQIQSAQDMVTPWQVANSTHEQSSDKQSTSSTTKKKKKTRNRTGTVASDPKTSSEERSDVPQHRRPQRTRRRPLRYR